MGYLYPTQADQLDLYRIESYPIYIFEKVKKYKSVLADMEFSVFAKILREANISAFNLAKTKLVGIKLGADDRNNARDVIGQMVHENLHQTIRRMNIRNDRLIALRNELKKAMP
jgi:hypothetical protein